MEAPYQPYHVSPSLIYYSLLAAVPPHVSLMVSIVLYGSPLMVKEWKCVQAAIYFQSNTLFFNIFLESKFPCDSRFYLDFNFELSRKLSKSLVKFQVEV